VTDSSDRWTGTVTVRLDNERRATRLERTLFPESAREVPRARASVDRGPAGTVRLSISARDTGSMRAAMNTYLGWIDLALATERTAGAPRRAPPG
jgi:tRNA threonylcarbamoyladenosine modification (KEOPS) complex  Pcc1 subunit